MIETRAVTLELPTAYGDLISAPMSARGYVGTARLKGVDPKPAYQHLTLANCAEAVRRCIAKGEPITLAQAHALIALILAEAVEDSADHETA